MRSWVLPSESSQPSHRIGFRQLRMVFPVPASRDPHLPVDHVQQSVAGGQCQIFSFLGSIRANWHSRRCNKSRGAARSGAAKIIGMGETWPADIKAFGLAFVHVQANDYCSSHLVCRLATFDYQRIGADHPLPPIQALFAPPGKGAVESPKSEIK